MLSGNSSLICPNEDYSSGFENSKSVVIGGNTEFINAGGASVSNQDIANLLASSENTNLHNVIINQAPGTIIENQIFDGVNITLIDSPNSIIRGNTIMNIIENVVYGIYIGNSSGTVIENNVISELTANSKAYGIYTKDSADLEITNNQIFSLTTLDGPTIGIYQSGSGNTTVAANEIFMLSGSIAIGIDLRLIGGSQIVSSNSIRELTAEEVVGISSISSEFSIFGLIEFNIITTLLADQAGRNVYGIAVIGTNFHIINNEIADITVIANDKATAFGISISANTYQIINNLISNIYVETSLAYVTIFGIYIKFGSDPNSLVSDNKISSLTAKADTFATTAGIYCFNSSNFVMEYNPISNLQSSAYNSSSEAEILLLESNLGTFNFVEGSTNTISWSHDRLPTYNQFYLYRDNIGIDAGPWIDGDWLLSTKIMINTDLPVGSYINTILVIDTIVGLPPVTDTLIVNILPVFEPTLVFQSAPTHVELGTVDNFVIWEFVDNNPSYAEIYLNQLVIENPIWISGDPIVYNLDQLGEGEYNVSIFVYDLDGNSANTTVQLTVQDTLHPEIVGMAEEFVQQEIVTSNITWYLIDFNPDYFWLYANGTEVINGTWQSDVPIILSLYDMDLGLTNFTMEANDLYGHMSRSTIYVNVIDTLEPLLNEPFDIFFTEGDLDHNLVWIAEDLNPGNWTLFENGINYQNGTWQSRIPITINLDGYKWGRYNFTIFVHDFFNNTIVDIVIVDISLSSGHTYTQNTETKSTDRNIFEDINPIYLAAGGVVIGVATIGSVLRRRRGF
jgi:hypothetical protein